MAIPVDAFVLSKSLALVEKTKRRVAQIDMAIFPTNSSGIARELLSVTLDSLGNRVFWEAMSPAALYNTLIHIQGLVEKVEASTSDHISWPLVSYCDHFWKLLLPTEEVQIFYSVFAEHNYSIGSFTNSLRLLLENVLPPSEIDRIIGGKQLYCLQIASLEDENLPLYANLGHEFGHALYRDREQQIIPIFVAECTDVFKSINSALIAEDSGPANRRLNRVVWIVKSIATELFCDLVGSMLAGPAFFLSLHEMGWGTDQNSWIMKLSPKDSRIRAYPSFAFRLSCVKKFMQLDTFVQTLQQKLESLPDEKDALKKTPTYVTVIPESHLADYVSVRPVSEVDAKAIQEAIEEDIPALKQCLEKFITRCSDEILASLRSQPEFSPVSPEQVFELIRRLDSEIIPNIIPSTVPKDSLLGVPASFATILNASALYRMYVLLTRKGDHCSEEINLQIQKVERLTAKALEVSYIQRDFNRWRGEESK